MGMLIETLSASHWTKVRPAADYSTNGYPTRGLTITKPSGDGVLAFGEGGAIASPFLKIVPIGTGADNNTFGMKIIGWRHTNNNVNQTVLVWVPTTIAIYAVTLGAATGIANSDFPANYFLADTITCTFGPTLIAAQLPTVLDWAIFSPADDSVGWIKQPSFGFRMIEIIFTTGGSATAANALYCKASGS